ncbi:Similar to Glycerol-3-phosphate dehydrogenase, mitochondrial; acc. no. A6QLU1 [Pyronema omphalodes CBS 100304]|uniref:Glycerol-3-phosphate dehydrogenase n=1 Tax=Pyronema omphalodes (strain CBS 100304) TaxID=1076935 RepID=U4KV92_PYROM|nr:Similar to Glycerol-3-phosphate dehydrogenase, mitochondrial; acc. no. A6QLU1 [Pyronema omphalodes CBS 100304]
MASARSTARSLAKPFLIGGSLGLAYVTYKTLRPPAPQARAVSDSSQPPKIPPIPSRLEQLNRLRAANTKETEYDLLIIGGGATGSGIALDAASRGLKVACIERDDFSSGTSSKSTKLVHGGVRYLEKAVKELDYSQYELVREALKERATFLTIAPHLSMSLPIMLPIYEWWKAPYFWAGTKCYDLLAGKENLESSYFLTRGKAIEAFPMLKSDGLAGALVYYDGSHNDSRMNVTIALTAAICGATIANHTEVTELLKDESGKICGVKARDLIDPKAENITIRAKGVINATGPFTDSIRKLDGGASTQEIVAPSSGVHIVLPGYFSPKHMGLIDPSTSDGRVIFFLPWQGNTIAGTTDAPTTITPHPLPREEEINWILSEVQRYVSPTITIRRSDVLAAWSGIRPLVKDPDAKNTESLVRNHLINVSPSGLITIAGGKWTTYRQMSEEAVDSAINTFSLPKSPCKTEQLQLVGAQGFSKTLFINLVQTFGIDAEVAHHLAHNYGDRAWAVAELSSPTAERFPLRGKRLAGMYPFIDGEVRYAVRNEYAQTAVDVLARRTRLAFLNVNAALEALPGVVDLMAEELKWDKNRKNKEWTDTCEFLVSMGLPEKRASVTRKEVENGIVKKWAEEDVGGEVKDVKKGLAAPGIINGGV